MLSVIIPAYNATRYLAAAVASVRPQLAADDEIIVVDDGSSDATAALAAELGATVLRQENLGPAAARNRGIEHARGDLLAFLDADDLWTATKLAVQLPLLHDPACEAVLGGVANFISPELDEKQQRSLAYAAQQQGTHHIGALLMRRETVARIGLFDRRWRHGEFIAWWAQALRLQLNYATMPQLVLQRRLHTDNLTRREPQGQRQYLALLREQLALRRQEQGRG